MTTGPQPIASCWCKGSLGTLAWSPDGGALAVVSSYGTYFLDPTSLALQRRIEARTYITTIEFSPDGILLAVGDAAGYVIELREALSGALLRLLSGHTGWITGIAFSPHGDYLASVSLDNGLRIWRVSDGVSLLRLSGSTRQLLGLAFRPDGKILASGDSDGSVKLWPVAWPEAFI